MLSVNAKTGEVSNVPDTIPLPTAAQSQAYVDAEATAKAKAELAQIDTQSLRSMREFILAKFPADPLLPVALASHESAAAIARAKIK